MVVFIDGTDLVLIAGRKDEDGHERDGDIGEAGDCTSI